MSEAPGTTENPRVTRSKRAVLAAAREVLAEQGFAGATIEAVAGRSGVAKTTIYRHWPALADLLIDAFEELVQPPGAPPPDTGSLRGDLRAALERLAAALVGSGLGRVLPAMVEVIERDPALAQRYARFARARREDWAVVLRRAAQRGELRGDLDHEAAIDLCAAPLFYRRLITRDPIDAQYLNTLVEAILAGLTHPHQRDAPRNPDHVP